MSAHHSAAMEWLCRASGRALFNEIIRRASSAEAHLLRSHHGASARTGAAAPVSVADAAASGSGAVVGAQSTLAAAGWDAAREATIVEWTSGGALGSDVTWPATPTADLEADLEGLPCDGRGGRSGGPPPPTGSASSSAPNTASSSAPNTASSQRHQVTPLRLICRCWLRALLGLLDLPVPNPVVASSRDENLGLPVPNPVVASSRDEKRRAVSEVCGAMLATDPAVAFAQLLGDHRRASEIIGDQLRTLLLCSPELASRTLPRLSSLLYDPTIASVGSPCMSAGASLCVAAVRALALQSTDPQLMRLRRDGARDGAPSATELAGGIQVVARVVQLALEGAIPERCSSVLHDGAFALTADAMHAWQMLAERMAGQALRARGAEHALALCRPPPSAEQLQVVQLLGLGPKAAAAAAAATAASHCHKCVPECLAKLHHTAVWNPIAPTRGLHHWTCPNVGHPGFVEARTAAHLDRTADAADAAAAAAAPPRSFTADAPPVWATVCTLLLQRSPKSGRLFGSAISADTLRAVWEATLRTLAHLDPTEVRSPPLPLVPEWRAVLGAMSQSDEPSVPAAAGNGHSAGAGSSTMWLYSLISEALAPGVEPTLRLPAVRWCRTPTLVRLLREETPQLAALAAALAGVPGQQLHGVAAIATADGGTVLPFTDEEREDEQQEGMELDDDDDDDDDDDGDDDDDDASEDGAASPLGKARSLARKRKRAKSAGSGAAVGAITEAVQHSLADALAHVESLNGSALERMRPAELFSVLEALGERAKLATRLLRATQRAQQKVARALSKVHKKG